MKKYSLMLISLLLSVNIYSQNLSLEWVKSAGTNSFYNVTGNAIVVDNLGNVYSTGDYSDTVDFDPGPGVTNLAAIGSSDVFIQKLDASGNLVWVKSIGGPGSISVQAIIIDSLGYIYTTGLYSGTIDFDPGIGLSNLMSNGMQDIFVQKMDPLGNLVWAKSMGGAGNDIGYTIKIDALGNVYIAGTYSDTVDFDSGLGINNFIANGSSDIFIQKLDALGNFIWTKSMGGVGNDGVGTIVLDDLGNIYTTGYYMNTVDFDPGVGLHNFTAIGGLDMFIQKLDALGNLVWAKSIGGAGSIDGRTIVLDKFSNIYVSGAYDNTVDFDPGLAVYNLTSNGSLDIFIQKLDPLGNLLWAKSVGGTSVDVGISIVVDSLGNSYTASEYYNTVDFDPGPGINNITSNGNIDIAIQKLDPFGSFLWVKSVGGPSYELVGGMDIDNMGNLYTTGSFDMTVDFDPGTGVTNLTSTGNGGFDFFVQKLGLCLNTVATDVQVACAPYTWIDGNMYNASNNTATHTLANAAGCDSIITLDLTISSIDTSVLLSGNTIVANSPGILYQWIDCSNQMPISGANNQSFSPSQNGVYAVILTDNSSGVTCIDTSSCISLTLVNVQNIQELEGYTVYPTPTSAILFLERLDHKEIEISVVNNLGQVLYTKISNTSKDQIPVQNLETGVYYLVIKDGKQVICTPFIKM